MDQIGTAKRWLRAGALTVVGLTTLACDQIEGFEMPAFLQGDDAQAGSGNLAAAAEGSGESRDVEAPEVFQKTEAGLWDGRPSLGGVWVAHPDVDDPERVIIRNEDNGRFVVGALFRRERDNPGPSLQVSSDAAEELGMLAGAPVTLNVTALRREEVAPAAAAPPDAVDGADSDGTLAPPAAISETPLDAVGTVAAPVAAASVGAVAGAAQQAPAAAAPVLPAAPAASAAATSTIDAIAGAAAAVAAAEAEAGLAADVLPAPDAAVGAPLDARGAVADTVPLPEPVTSGLEKPFIQVGIFSVEGNANDAATTLRGDGISASVVEQNSSGTAFWRVLVGPAPTAQDRTDILAKVQALGFNDAYFVSN